MSEDESRRNRRPAHIAEIIAELRRTTPLGMQLEVMQIWENWPEIAGPALAAHGAPYSVKDGLLRVGVDSAVWMHKFSYHKWRIIKRINRHARKELVHDLFLVLESRDEESPAED